MSAKIGVVTHPRRHDFNSVLDHQGILNSTYGGTGIDSSALTGTPQVVAGTWSILGTTIADTAANTFTITRGATDLIVSADCTIDQNLAIASSPTFAQLNVDNLRLDGNTLSSTDANGDVIINPNGSGDIDASTSTIKNVIDPGNAQDAATKNYVDGLVGGAVPPSTQQYSILVGAAVAGGWVEDTGFKVTTGAVTTGSWTATVIGTQYGGTGQNTSAYAQYSMLYYTAAGTIGELAKVNSAVLVTSAAGLPGWDAGRYTNWDAASAHVSADGSSHGFINQDVQSTASPTFVVLILSAASATLTHSGATSLTIISTLGTVIIEGLTFNGTVVTGATSITSTAFVGDLTGNASGSSGSCTGNALTATTLQTARTIGGVNFNGSAAIVPETIAVVDESADTSCYVAFFTDTSGSYQPKTGTNLTFNSNTGLLTATILSNGTINLTGSNITGVSNMEVTETITFDLEFDNGNSGVADTINWGNGNKQKSTLNGNCNYTFTAPDGPCNLVLRIIHSGASRNPSWPATVKWAGGAEPIWSAVDGRIDIVTFYYNGANYYGMAGIHLA